MLFFFHRLTILINAIFFSLVARPARITGLITGSVNEISFSTTRYAAQADIRSGRTMATIGDVPDELSKALNVLVPVLWPAYWLNAPAKKPTEHLNDGFSLTKADFKATGEILFMEKKLMLEYTGRGLDGHGQARVRY